MIDLTSKPAEEQNPHRKKFLLLLAALGLVYIGIAKRYRHQIVGMLASMAGIDGRVLSQRMPSLAHQLEIILRQYQFELEHEFILRQPAAIDLGARLGGDEQASPEAILAAEERLHVGAIGVPFEKVAGGAFMLAGTLISGAVGRSILDPNKSVMDIEPSVATALETLNNKLTSEAFTQLNGAFVASTIETVKHKPEVEELVFVLSPTLDHCNWCPSHAGNVYPKDHPVWSMLPKHPRCQCHPIPVGIGVETNQELVAS